MDTSHHLDLSTAVFRCLLLEQDVVQTPETVLHLKNPELNSESNRNLDWNHSKGLFGRSSEHVHGFWIFYENESPPNLIPRRLICIRWGLASFLELWGYSILRINYIHWLQRSSLRCSPATRRLKPAVKSLITRSKLSMTDGSTPAFFPKHLN